VRALVLSFVTLIAAACATLPESARVVPSAVDTDDGAFEVEVRLPGSVRPGTTVEVAVVVTGRKGIATYDESFIDFSINGRGLSNARSTAIGGEVFTTGFLGLGGTIFARGRNFGPRSRLGFAARFDVAPDALVREMQFQVHATVSGGAPSKSFVRNYVATFVQ